MLRRVTPTTIQAPFAKYSHGTVVPSDARWLYVSGQLGIRADGTIPDDFEAQAEVCFENVLAILAEAGMDAGDLVRINSYLVDEGDVSAYIAVRDRYVIEPPPASTLLIVRALVRPQFRIEVEAVAARSV